MSDIDITPGVTGATLRIGSDCYPYTVVEVLTFKSGAKAGQVRGVKVTGDEAIVISGGEHDGSAQYRYESRLDDEAETFLRRTDGRFYSKGGSRLTVGNRRRYIDPHI